MKEYEKRGCEGRGYEGGVVKGGDLKRRIVRGGL